MIILLVLINRIALWFSFIHIVHIVRGILGIIILSGLPSLTDLIKKAPLEDKTMRMGEITSVFIDYLKSKSLEYLDRAKPKLTWYGIITIICIIIDGFLLIQELIVLLYNDLVIVDVNIGNV